MSSFLQQAFSTTRKEIELLDKHLTAIRFKMVDMKAALDKLIEAECARTGQTPAQFTDAAMSEMLTRVKAAKSASTTSTPPEGAGSAGV